MESFMFIFAIAVVSVGCGFQTGYNLGVVNNPQQVITDWMKSLKLDYLSDSLKLQIYWSWVVSGFNLGGMLGGIVSPLLNKVAGRRGGLIINNVIAMVGGCCMCVTKKLGDPTWLMAGRIVAGINVGINCALCPIYLIEISPMQLRGAMGSLFQLFITFSILVAMVISLKPVLGEEDHWPYLFTLLPIAAFLQFICLFFLPESPKYLMDTDKEEKARNAFNKFHGKKETAGAEFEEIKKNALADRAEPKITLKVFFSNKVYLKPFGLCMFLMIAQQLSGINAVIFYSTDIFKKAKLNELTAQLFTASIGLVNFLATIVAVAIIEKLGRKPLLLWGFVAMAFATAFLMLFLYLSDHHDWAKHVCLVCIIIFIIGFAIGAGPIPWVLFSEVFVTSARPLVAGFLVPTNWLFNLIVAFCFPVLQRFMGPLVFVIFLTFQVISVAIIFFFMPETKNRPIEEIINDFK